MGVGAPCTQALSIFDIWVHDRKLDLITLLRTGEHGTEREILPLFL